MGIKEPFSPEAFHAGLNRRMSGNLNSAYIDAFRFCWGCKSVMPADELSNKDCNICFGARTATISLEDLDR